MSRKVNENSESAKAIEAAVIQSEIFEENIKSLTMDRMNEAPKEDVEPQTKLSQIDIAKSKDIYLKPSKSIACKEKFNEKFRKQYEFDKEYVHFIAENKELIGETIEMWTRPYPGLAAEFWEVPTNKAVYGPRYLAEQIKRKSYHKLTMQQNTITNHTGFGQFYGSMAVDSTVQRLDAIPVNNRKSVFMGAF